MNNKLKNEKMLHEGDQHVSGSLGKNRKSQLSQRNPAKIHSI